MDQKTAPPPIAVPSIEPTKPFLGNRILLFLSLGILVVLMGVALLYKTYFAPEQNSTTTSKITAHNSKMAEQSNISIGNQTIFAIGGFYKDKNKTTPATNSAEFYNESTGTWEFTPAMHVSHAGAAVTAYNNTIYVFGGQSGNTQGGTTAVEMFDPATNQWTLPTPLPHPRVFAQAITLGNKIYILGGWDVTGTNDTAVDIYNPVSNNWQNGTPLPTTNDDITSRCSGVQNKIYCPGLGDHSYTLEYDPTTNQWQSLPTQNRQQTVNFNWASNDQFMYGVYFQNSNNVQEFDQATDTITTVQGGKYIDRTYQGFSPLSVGNNLFLIGGKFSADPVRDVYMFNVASSTSWQKTTPLNIGRSEAGVALLPILYTGKSVTPSPTPLSNASTTNSTTNHFW